LVELDLTDLELATTVKATIGNQPSVNIPHPEIKIKSVCQTCNNQWMSALETQNRASTHAMINDDPCWLTEKDQKSLVRWALMKAMVIESANRKRSLFYSIEEKMQIKSDSDIPAATLVWLGRLSAKAFHAGGTDIWGDIDNVPKAFHGCVTSIIVGHLVIQVLSGHVHQQFGSYEKMGLSCKPGAWDVNLLDIWPSADRSNGRPQFLLHSKGRTTSKN